MILRSTPSAVPVDYLVPCTVCDVQQQFLLHILSGWRSNVFHCLHFHSAGHQQLSFNWRNRCFVSDRQKDWSLHGMKHLILIHAYIANLSFAHLKSQQRRPWSQITQEQYTNAVWLAACLPAWFLKKVKHASFQTWDYLYHDHRPCVLYLAARSMANEIPHTEASKRNRFC